MADAVSITEGLIRMVELVMADCDYLAVGSADNVTTAGDSQLTSETNRVIAADKFQTGARFQVRTLFSNSNMPTVIEEVGLFMDASSGPNSGEMLVKATEKFTKNSDDLLLVFDVTIS